MAAGYTEPPKNRQRKAGLLTLVELLDQAQPYEKMDRLQDPELDISDDEKLRKIQGSLVGLAIGDALGASVEFRPYAYLKENPVKDMQGGGTWGLQAGQWTDDTSMALCLAASLIVKGKSDPYDQFVRYQRWYKNGYMSSTGKCFDIGKSTREAITKFENRLEETRRKLIADKIDSKLKDFDAMLEHRICKDNPGLKYGTSDSAGNGPLMRLAPIPCFFFQSYEDVKTHIDVATQLTHGDQRATDACQFYAGLIWHALNGMSKTKILEENFYHKHLKLTLHEDILEIAKGSYKTKDGYEGGIRGKGYVVNALEAALWAFYNDDDKFDVGVLKAINLGDDTDTTAAIYGELAGAMYGIDNIPPRWTSRLYQEKFIMTVANGLYVSGRKLVPEKQKSNWTSPNATHRNNEKRNEANTPPSHQHTNDNSTSQHTKDNSTSQHTKDNSTSQQPQPKSAEEPPHPGVRKSANNGTSDKKNVISE